MDKGTHTARFERLVPVDPTTAHKIFLERTWWGGGLPWYLNIMSTYTIEPAKEEGGAGGTRQVPTGLHETILKSELGKFMEYTVTRRVWFPVSYHRGRIDFYPAGPDCTRLVWTINFTPFLVGRPVLPFFWIIIDIMATNFQNECVKRSATPKKRYANSGSWVWLIIKVLLALYVAFMVNRASRIPRMKPQPPGPEYMGVTDRVRKETAKINAVVSKSTYLVIGGTGFTGSGLVDDLRKRGAKKIKIMGRSIPPSIEYPYGYSKDDMYPLPNVEYVRGAVTDKKALAEAMKGVDVVFHIAVSYGNPTFGSLLSQESTERINFGGMKNIYDAAKNAGTVKQIVYTSSGDVVFTTKALHKVNETHPYLAYGITDQVYAKGDLQVGDAYARTKILAEEFLLSQDNNDNIRTVSLRPNGIYGPGEFSNWKKTIDVPYILGGLPFYIDETQKADWTCLYNLVYAHVLATYKLATEPNSVGGKAYFITDDEITNTAAMEVFRPAIEAAAGPIKRWLKVPPWIMTAAGHAQEVFQKFIVDTFGVQVPIFLTYKETLKVVVSHYYDNTRARKDLGYEPVISTEQCKQFTAEEFRRRYWDEY